MSLYLDASFLLPMFFKEPRSSAVDAFLARTETELLVSNFTAAEVASAASLFVRTGRATVVDARDSLAVFDVWKAAKATEVEIRPADIRLADAYIRRFDLMLKAPDAIHVSVCQRLGVPLATFDRRLAAAAEALGLNVEVVD